MTYWCWLCDILNLLAITCRVMCEFIVYLSFSLVSYEILQDYILIQAKCFDVQDGRLRHDNLAYIWEAPKYSTELRPWLLRLTEEYDLTFPLRDEAVSLVPCLLPDVDTEVCILLNQRYLILNVPNSIL